MFDEPKERGNAVNTTRLLSDEEETELCNFISGYGISVKDARELINNTCGNPARKPSCVDRETRNELIVSVILAILLNIAIWTPKLIEWGIIGR